MNFKRKRKVVGDGDNSSSRNGELLAHTLIEILDGRDLAIWAEGSLEASNLSDAPFRVDLGGKEVHRLPTYVARLLQVALARIGGSEKRLVARGIAAKRGR